MIVRGMGALVKAGTPYFPGQGPLLETDISTIAGLERLGGRFGVSVPPRFSRRPVPYIPGSRRWGGTGVQGYRGRRGLSGPIVAVDIPAAPGTSTGHQGAVATFENLTTGDASFFRQGDQWRISIVGAAPNNPVYLNSHLDGAPATYSGLQDVSLSAWTGKTEWGDQPVGQTNAAGSWSAAGVMGPAQAGKWQHSWNISELLMPIIFRVADASGNVPLWTGTQAGTAYYTLAGNHPPTQPAPAPVVLSLAEMLAKYGITLPGSTPATAGTPPAAVATGGAGSPAVTGGGGTPANVPNPDSFDVGGLLTGSVFLGIPNWILLAGIGGAWLLLRGK